MPWCCIAIMILCETSIRTRQDHLHRAYYKKSSWILQPMGSNYFLWIIIVISVLAVLSWALGYI